MTSPVFFSTDSEGVVRQGLSAVPHDRPMLFVGNHQTYALDIGPLIETLIKERQIFARGLAHPALWAVSYSRCFYLNKSGNNCSAAKHQAL